VSPQKTFHYLLQGEVIMTLTANLSRSKSITAIVALLILSSAALFQGCGHNTGSLSFASHKVKLDRHGITNRFGLEERGQLAIFHYDGYGLKGDRLRVTVENEKVTINDQMIGMLKQGDSISITDDGVTVNALDHGQTAKYLQENATQATAKSEG
jgi:hypothetical protein